MTFSSSTGPRRKLSVMKKPIFSTLYIVFITFFIILPLLLILYFSLIKVSNNKEVIFTLDNFIRFFKFNAGRNINIEVLTHSFILAISCTLLCLLIGFPASCILSKSRLKCKEFLLFLMIAPMWINFLLRTYAWLSILENNGLMNQFLNLLGISSLPLMYNDGAVLFVMTCNYFPFMILPIHSSLEKIDNSLIEASADLGSSKMQTFLKITLPLSINGIISGSIMVFVPAITTFVISRYFNGSSMLFGDLIEQQFSLGDFYFGSALSIILIVIILLISGFTKNIGSWIKNIRLLFN